MPPSGDGQEVGAQSHWTHFDLISEFEPCAIGRLRLGGSEAAKETGLGVSGTKWLQPDSTGHTV